MNPKTFMIAAKALIKPLDYHKESERYSIINFYGNKMPSSIFNNKSISMSFINTCFFDKHGAIKSNQGKE